MKQKNLSPLVVVNESPETFVNDDVVIVPADPLLTYSITIEHAELGGASVCAPPFVAYWKLPFAASGV